MRVNRLLAKNPSEAGKIVSVGIGETPSHYRTISGKSRRIYGLFIF